MLTRWHSWNGEYAVYDTWALGTRDIMGIEHKILFEGATSIDLDRLLRAESSFVEFKPQYGSYEFRSKGSSKDSMPDAEARIETNGLYFCDYGGEGSRILANLINTLSAHYGKIEKREYE